MKVHQAHKQGLFIGVVERLLYWDGERAHTILEAEERVYGITWDRERIYVAAGRNSACGIVVLNDRLDKIGVISVRDGLRDVHQILWWNEWLYVVQTGRSTIVCLENGEREGRSITWPGRFCEKGEDPHINSIWCDGQYFYVVEHWHGQLPKRIRRFDLGWQMQDTIEIRPKVLLEKKLNDIHSVRVAEYWHGQLPKRMRGFDRSWQVSDTVESEPRMTIGKKSNGIHNVYIEHGILYTLCPEAVVRIDIEKRRADVLEVGTFSPSYLRGLARTRDSFYVGVSRFTPDQRNRICGDAAFLITNSQLEVERVVTLENAGQVFEIRALAGDLAHNGLPCPFQG